MKTILTLDVGTTSVKACLFDETFRLLGSSAEEYGLITPGKGIVELDPEAYWQACRHCVAELGRSQTAAPGLQEVCSVGVTTQGETMIPVDRTGRPQGRAIVWLDARAVEEAEQISAGFGPDEVYRATGLAGIAAASPAAKALWIKRNKPEIYDNTHKFLLLLDYLLLRLTGRFVTDRCILSSTGYFDINEGCYWQRMLTRLGIECDLFPEAIDAGTVAGIIRDEAAIELGINRGAAVVPCGMDQASSAVGAGNIVDGVITETTGTALVVAQTSDSPDFSNTSRVNVMRHAISGKYLVLPYNPTAGIVLKWFKDEFCTEEARRALEERRSVYDVLGELAASVPELSGGLIAFPHFEGMLSPVEDAAARGVFFGASLATGKGHFVRSIMEGVAYMLRESVELLESMGVVAKELRSLGGGARSELWSQIKADVCGKTVLTMEAEESASLGAAIQAAVASGLFSGCNQACSVCIRIGREYAPNGLAKATYEKGYRRYKELYERLRGLF